MEIDPREFRQTLGHVPTAVTVITAEHDHRRIGMTVGSFTSISLDPPLVGFFADTGSGTVAGVQAAGRFCVSVLARGQQAVARSFATHGNDRFAGIDVSPGHNGAPRLSEALAWIECDLHSVTPLGDHLLLTGSVTALEVSTRQRRPLVFFRGTFCDLDSVTVPDAQDWHPSYHDNWW